jgi:hypothetical protein
MMDKLDENIVVWFYDPKKGIIETSSGFEIKILEFL